MRRAWHRAQFKLFTRASFLPATREAHCTLNFHRASRAFHNRACAHARLCKAPFISSSPTGQPRKKKEATVYSTYTRVEKSRVHSPEGIYSEEEEESFSASQRLRLSETIRGSRDYAGSSLVLFFFLYLFSGYILRERVCFSIVWN